MSGEGRATERSTKGKGKSSGRRLGGHGRELSGADELKRFDSYFGKQGKINVFPEVKEPKVKAYQRSKERQPRPHLQAKQNEWKETPNLSQRPGTEESSVTGKTRLKIKEPDSYVLNEKKLQESLKAGQAQGEEGELLVIERTKAALEEIMSPCDPPVFLLHNQQLGKPRNVQTDVLVLHPSLGVLVLEVKATTNSKAITHFNAGASKLLYAQKLIQEEMGDLLEKDAIALTIALPNLRGEYADDIKHKLKIERREVHPYIHLLCGSTAGVFTDWVQRLVLQRSAASHAFKGTSPSERLVNFKRACIRRFSVAGLRPGQSIKTSADLHNRFLLTEEQLRVRDSQAELLHISGPPGSGKTLLLVERARRWLREGRRVALATGLEMHDLLLHHLAWTVCGERAGVARVSTHSSHKALLAWLDTVSTEDSVSIIVDEALIIFADAYGGLLNHVIAGRVRGLWSADIQRLPDRTETALRRLGGSMVQLSLCLRCPPHIMAWTNSVRSEEDLPLLPPPVPVTQELGVGVDLISHADHPKSQPWYNCTKCGEEVTAFFSSLGLLGDGATSALKLRDVVVITSPWHCDRGRVARWLRGLGLHAVAEESLEFFSPVLVPGVTPSSRDHAEMEVQRDRMLKGVDVTGKPVIHVVGYEKFRGLEKPVVLLWHDDRSDEARGTVGEREFSLSQHRYSWFLAATRCQGRLVVMAATPSPLLPLLPSPRFSVPPETSGFGFFDKVYNKKGKVQVFPDFIESKVTLFEKRLSSRLPKPTDRERPSSKTHNSTGMATDSCTVEASHISPESQRHEVHERASSPVGEHLQTTQDETTRRKGTDVAMKANENISESTRSGQPEKGNHGIRIKEPKSYVLNEEKLVNPNVQGQMEAEECEFLVLQQVMAALEQAMGPHDPPVFLLHNQDLSVMVEGKRRTKIEQDVLILHSTLGVLLLEVKAVGNSTSFSRFDTAAEQLLRAQEFIQEEMGDLLGKDAVVLSIALPKLTPEDADNIRRRAEELASEKNEPDVTAMTSPPPIKDRESRGKESGGVEKGTAPKFKGSAQLGIHPEILLLCGSTSEVFADWVKQLQQRRASSSHTYRGTTDRERLDSFKCACIRRFSTASLRPGQSINASANFYTSFLLTQEQLRVRDSQAKLLHISGPPGSGKTLLLAERARRWLREGYRLALAVGLPFEDVLLNQLVLSVCRGKADEARVSTHKHHTDLLKWLDDVSPEEPVAVILDEIVSQGTVYHLLMDRFESCRVAEMWTADTLPLPDHVRERLTRLGGDTAQLTHCLRCPPNVIALANRVRNADEPQLFPPPLQATKEVGVEVEVISHYDHHHSPTWDACSACLKGVEDFFSGLDLLRESTMSALSYRDIVVLTTVESCDRQSVAAWLQGLNIPARHEKIWRYDTDVMVKDIRMSREEIEAMKWRRRVLSGEDDKGKPALHVLGFGDFRGLEKAIVLLWHEDREDEDRARQQQVHRDSRLIRHRHYWFHAVSRCQGRLLIVATTPSPLLPLLQTSSATLDLSMLGAHLVSHHSHSQKDLPFWQCDQCGQALVQRLRSQGLPVRGSPAADFCRQTVVVLTGWSCDGAQVEKWLIKLGIPAVFEEPQRNPESRKHDQAEVEEWVARVKAGKDRQGQLALHIVQDLHRLVPTVPVVVLIHHDEDDNAPGLQNQERRDSRQQWQHYCWSQALSPSQEVVVLVATPSPLLALLKPPSPTEFSSQVRHTSPSPEIQHHRHRSHTKRSNVGGERKTKSPATSSSAPPPVTSTSWTFPSFHPPLKDQPSHPIPSSSAHSGTMPSQTFPSSSASMTMPSQTFPSSSAPPGSTPSQTFPSPSAPWSTPSQTFPPSVAPEAMPSQTFPSSSDPWSKPSQTFPSSFAPPGSTPSRTFPSSFAPPGSTPSQTFPSSFAPPWSTPSQTFPSSFASPWSTPSQTFPSSSAPWSTPSQIFPSSFAPPWSTPSQTSPSSSAPGSTPSQTFPSFSAPEAMPSQTFPSSFAPPWSTPSQTFPPSSAPGPTPSQTFPSSFAPPWSTPSQTFPSSSAPEAMPSQTFPSSFAPPWSTPSQTFPPSSAPGPTPSQPFPSSSAPTGSTPSQTFPSSFDPGTMPFQTFPSSFTPGARQSQTFPSSFGQGVRHHQPFPSFAPGTTPSQTFPPSSVPGTRHFQTFPSSSAPRVRHFQTIPSSSSAPGVRHSHPFSSQLFH